jgi:hypothetical protein
LFVVDRARAEIDVHFHISRRAGDASDESQVNAVVVADRQSVDVQHDLRGRPWRQQKERR